VRFRRGEEAGYTLTEVLVAVIILAVGVTGIVAAMASGVLASRVSRDSVTSDALVRSYAEQLLGATYLPCATTASYGAYSGAHPNYTVSVTKVQYWTGGNPASFQATCPTDKGGELLTIRAQATGKPGAQQLQIFKRAP
jgi:prepilin-type N-terminal cleavage/methylation domain-containing protein